MRFWFLLKSEPSYSSKSATDADPIANEAISFAWSKPVKNSQSQITIRRPDNERGHVAFHGADHALVSHLA